jgi:hypothetical protein
VGQTIVVDPNIINRHLQRAIDAGSWGKMTREDFKDPYTKTCFLSLLVTAQYNRKRGPVAIGSAYDLSLFGDPADHVRGTAMTEADFRTLLEDLVFAFEGNKWTIEFNAFGTDGGMDRWTLAGTFDPQEGTNVITKAQYKRVYEDASWLWSPPLPPEPNESSANTSQETRDSHLLHGVALPTNRWLSPLSPTT